MAIQCDDINDKELERLFILLNNNINAHNRLIELKEYFPTPALIELVKKIKKLKEALEKVPLELWVDLIRFIQCDLEAIKEKKKEQILKLVDILDGHLKIEKADPKIPGSNEKLEEMIKLLELAREAIKTGDDKNAIEEIRNLKEKYKLQYAAIWSIILSIYHQGLLDDFAKAGSNLIKPKIGKFIKKLIKTLIESRLKKKLAKKVAEKGVEKIIPYVGPILTLLEVLSYGAVVNGIKSYEKAICELLCCVLKQLAERGYKWPLTHPFVYAIPSKLVTKDFPVWTVTYRNFVYCCYRTEDMGEEDCCEWSEKCSLQFEGETRSRGFVVTDPPVAGSTGTVDPITGILHYPNPIKEKSLKQSTCLNPKDGKKLVKCYVTTRIEINSISITKPPKFRRDSQEIINGVKIF